MLHWPERAVSLVWMKLLQIWTWIPRAQNISQSHHILSSSVSVDLLQDMILPVSAMSDECHISWMILVSTRPQVRNSEVDQFWHIKHKRNHNSTSHWICTIPNHLTSTPSTLPRIINMHFPSSIILAISTLMSSAMATAINHAQASNILAVSKPLLAELAANNPPVAFSPRGASGLEKRAECWGSCDG